MHLESRLEFLVYFGEILGFRFLRFGMVGFCHRGDHLLALPGPRCIQNFFANQRLFRGSQATGNILQLSANFDQFFIQPTARAITANLAPSLMGLCVLFCTTPIQLRGPQLPGFPGSELPKHDDAHPG